MGELAQLAGRPSLVDAYAQGPVEALLIPPDQLRALLIAAHVDLVAKVMGIAESVGAVSNTDGMRLSVVD